LLVVPKLGTTNYGGSSTTLPAEAKIIIGGSHTRREWGGNAGSINTVLASVSQGSSQTVSSLLVLGMVIRRADTGCHTQQPLISVGDVTIVEHFVK